MIVGTHLVAFLVGLLLGLMVRVGRAEAEQELDDLFNGRKRKP